MNRKIIIAAIICTTIVFVVEVFFDYKFHPTTILGIIFQAIMVLIHYFLLIFIKLYEWMH